MQNALKNLCSSPTHHSHSPPLPLYPNKINLCKLYEVMIIEITCFWSTSSWIKNGTFLNLIALQTFIRTKESVWCYFRRSVQINCTDLVHQHGSRFIVYIANFGTLTNCENLLDNQWSMNSAWNSLTCCKESLWNLKKFSMSSNSSFILVSAQERTGIPWWA